MLGFTYVSKYDKSVCQQSPPYPPIVVQAYVVEIVGGDIKVIQNRYRKPHKVRGVHERYRVQGATKQETTHVELLYDRC